MNTHIVLWSGGHDSTLTLIRVTKEHSTMKNKVIALTIKTTMVGQQQQENIARKKIKKELLKDGYHIEFKEIDGNLILPIERGEFALPQQTLWSAVSAFYAPNNSIVYFSYIDSDSYWQLKQSMEQTFNSICKNLGKECKIEYPLRMYQKKEVIEDIPKKYYKLVWFCENPKKNKKCNKCHKCLEVLFVRGGIKKRRVQKC